MCRSATGRPRRSRLPLLVLLPLCAALAAACTAEPGAQGPEGAQGPPGPPGPSDGDRGTAVEGCVQCHTADGPVPVVDVGSVGDVHYVDLDPDGPLTASGYRKLVITVTAVDVTGSSVIVDFDVVDELGGSVGDIFAADGRMVMARLVDGAGPGDPTRWQRLLSSERFRSGTFVFQGGASYRYTSVFDPTSIPVAAGDTLRVAVQLSASDLPPGNGWCDFDADLAQPNDCVSPVSRTRDIVQTATCNGCHGATSDTRLVFHGARTEVEYCVTCHNPDLGDADMPVLIHKIHMGRNLRNGYRDWSHVGFTGDLDDCAVCHTGGGADEDNWKTVPNRNGCGSCHDSVNFDTGEGHGTGGVQQTNQNCTSCHPVDGAIGPVRLPVVTVHRGDLRRSEAARYRGASNGFLLGPVAFDGASGQLTIPFAVARDAGDKMTLESDPEWTAPSGASRLAITLGWDTAEYTNEGSGSTPAPAQPLSYDALDVGGIVSALGGGDYELVVDLPGAAGGTVTVFMEGHPAADLDGDGVFADRIAVKNAFEHVAVDPREPLLARRTSVETAKCNVCHDAAGAGLSLHGNNRTSEIQVCVVCHNGDATDIRRRPSDPASTPDGRREQSVDVKRMVHQIHRGRDLQDGFVLYGFGGSVHDYSDVEFIGNLGNCETCHVAGAGIYGLEQAQLTLASTVDSGAVVTDPSDDLNVSPITAVCSSCHDDTASRRHMILHGGSFRALDENIE